MARIATDAVSRLFHDARSHNGWSPRPVSDVELQEIYEITRWAPTSANCSPLRVVFVRSAAAKAKLTPCLMEGNVAKTAAAPVTAILGMDLDFPEKLPRLFPHMDARAWFVGNQPFIESTAFRNSSLQCAYFMLAARAIGLDVGPMSGFDSGKVDAAFFAGMPVKTNMLCNLGHGDAAALFPRSPRLEFSEACRIE